MKINPNPLIEEKGWNQNNQNKKKSILKRRKSNVATVRILDIILMNVGLVKETNLRTMKNK